MVQTAFQPPFADALFFVHLNRKQDSREGISRYRTRRFDRAGAVATCTDLTAQLAEATTLESFRDALERHEQLISGILGMPAAKQKWFPDYPGSIKSLGAWGGDFILATGPESDREYFRQRGFATLRSYGDLILERKNPVHRADDGAFRFRRSAISRKSPGCPRFQPFPSGHYTPRCLRALPGWC